MINIAERIKELMEEREMSAYELSNQMGIAVNTVYDWFKIGAEPTMQNIMRVCEVMKISLETFFCGGRYEYTEEENRILREWHALSDLEKDAVLRLTATFKILKNG